MRGVEMTNRRGFLASLLALPTAAVAAARKRKSSQPQSIPPTEAAFREAIGESGGWPYQLAAYYHLQCDSCIDAIQHCATCGRPLANNEGTLRVSPASEPIRFSAWPKLPWAACEPQEPRCGIRPVHRDLIVADCPACASLRAAGRGYRTINEAGNVTGIDDPRLCYEYFPRLCYEHHLHDPR
jgi:hypothetical protein